MRGIIYKKIEHKLKDSLTGVSENSNILEIGCGSKIYKKIKVFLKIFAFLLRTLSYPSYSYFKMFVTLCQCILDIIYICTHVYNFNTIEKRHKIILQLMEVVPVKSPNNRLVSSPFHKRKSIP